MVAKLVVTLIGPVVGMIIAVEEHRPAVALIATVIVIVLIVWAYSDLRRLRRVQNRSY